MVTMAAAYQLLYNMCEYIGKTSEAPGLEGACQTIKYIFFYIQYIYIYVCVHDFFSVSFYISLPFCVEAIRNRTTDIIYLTCGQSIYTHTNIHKALLIYGPGGDGTPLPPPTAYAAVSVGYCYYYIISIPTDYRRVCGIARLQKHEKMIRHVPTYIYIILL